MGPGAGDGAIYPHTADGTPVPAAATTSAPYAAGPNARSAPATTAGQEGVVGGGAGEIGEKAKHFFEQGLATVSVSPNAWLLLRGLQGPCFPALTPR